MAAISWQVWQHCVPSSRVKWKEYALIVRWHCVPYVHIPILPLSRSSCRSGKWWCPHQWSDKCRICFCTGALEEANIFESKLQLFEPLCVIIMHVLTTTTGDTAVTKIPERHLFKKLPCWKKDSRVSWQGLCENLVTNRMCQQVCLKVQV